MVKKNVDVYGGVGTFRLSGEGRLLAGCIESLKKILRGGQLLFQCPAHKADNARTESVLHVLQRTYVWCGDKDNQRCCWFTSGKVGFLCCVYVCTEGWYKFQNLPTSLPMTSWGHTVLRLKFLKNADKDPGLDSLKSLKGRAAIRVRPELRCPPREFDQ